MLNQQENYVKHRSFVHTVQSTYNEVCYNEKISYIEQIINPHQLASVYIKFGYCEVWL